MSDHHPCGVSNLDLIFEAPRYWAFHGLEPPRYVVLGLGVIFVCSSTVIEL